MGQALYRRYRSKNLAEIVGQEHITTTLDNALKRDAVGHAYLLTGPRGVGKTSIARILAHEINQLPYDKEQVHLDIIEIDAASNRRIDEIRDLRDKVHISPTSAKYKVYIIDEVHMLTKEAFNALLKTLEEPPAHVIFILATTDVHKLPETIISRTQHFTFKPISSSKIVEHLKVIAKKEKIVIEDEALQIIADHGGGSFRDSIGLLEQASTISENINGEQVRLMLGIPPDNLIEDLCKSFQKSKPKDAVNILKQIRDQGYLAEETASQLAVKIREIIIDQSSASPLSYINLLTDLIDVQASRDPQISLEIAIIKNMDNLIINAPQSAVIEQPTIVEPVASKQTASNESSLELETPKEDEQVKTEDIKKDTEPESDPISQDIPPAPTPEPKSEEQTAKNSNEIVTDELWNSILGSLKGNYSTLYSVARMAEFTTDGKDITLKFKFPFHKKRLDSEKHKAILNEVISSVTSLKPVVKTEIIEKSSKAQAPIKKPEAKPSNHLETVSNIFGGGEVLES